MDRAESVELDEITPIEDSSDNLVQNKCDDSTGKKHRVLAIAAKNLYLSVGRPPKTLLVLKDFNISVPAGVIYGILGPSGCGKTTFLRCVVNLNKQSSGELLIFGFKPGEVESGIPGLGVGYMPQELALQMNLTIYELLKYFGQLHYLSPPKIDAQIDYLITSLDLPDKNRLISNLSCGQQRRVSYACSLVHNPRIVILDEPTVGVDPILRERIWQHLLNLTKNNVTVIVTTHYIEETRRADLVGLMEDGRMLIESSPRLLMRKLNSTTLEEAFLHISRSDKKHVEEVKRSIQADNETDTYLSEKQPLFANRLTWKFFIVAWISRLLLVVDKLLIQTKRTPQQLITLFVLPTLVIMIFCVCVGESPHDIYVAIVNEENPRNFSQNFIDSLPKYVVKVSSYNNIDEAVESVKQKLNFAAIYIPENFTDAIITRTNLLNLNPKQLALIDLNRTLEESTITIHADASHKPLFVTMERVFEQSLLHSMQELASKLGKNPKLVSLPISNAGALYGRYIEGDYAGWRDFETSGILIVLVYIFACGVQSLALIVEKNNKIYDRVYTTGVSPAQLLLAHLISRFLPVTIMVLIAYIVAVYLFQLPSEGSIFWTFLLLLLQAFNGLCNGMFLSALTESAMGIAFIGQAVLLTIFVVSGTLWPFEGLPYWMRWIAAYSPIAAPTEALRSLLLRGWPASHPVIVWGFLVSLGWSVILLSFTILVLNLEKLIHGT